MGRACPHFRCQARIDRAGRRKSRWAGHPREQPGNVAWPQHTLVCGRPLTVVVAHTLKGMIYRTWARRPFRAGQRTAHARGALPFGGAVLGDVRTLRFHMGGGAAARPTRAPGAVALVAAHIGQVVQLVLDKPLESYRTQSPNPHSGSIRRKTARHINGACTARGARPHCCAPRPLLRTAASRARHGE